MKWGKSKTILKTLTTFCKDWKKQTSTITADVSALYPSIPHDSGLKAMYEKNKKEVKEILLADLVNMDEFVLKSVILNWTPKLGNKFLIQP